MRTEANAPPTDPADAWLSTTAAKDTAAARLHVLHARYGPNHSGGFSLHEAVTARPRDATSIRGLNPVLRELFIGLSDENSPLSKLSADLLYLVFLELSSWWEAHIVREGVFASSISSYDRVHRQRSGTVPVTFPPSKDIMINMMPIRIGVDEDVPKEYQQYLPLLHACPAWADPKSRDESHFSFMRDGVERVGYLTIHESRIEEDETSQRRGGLHTETPGCVGAGGEWVPASAPGALTVAWGGGFAELDSSGDEGGDTTYTYRGGIYMASSVADSTRVWNVKVDKPQEVVGTLGDLEHLRGRLGEGATLKAGELCWMTDATPHESLPLPKGTYRQYFRLVTSDVNVWYSKHSTPNPLGIKPGKMVKIVDGDKFAMAAASSSAVGVVSRAMAAMGLRAIN